MANCASASFAPGSRLLVSRSSFFARLRSNSRLGLGGSGRRPSGKVPTDATASLGLFLDMLPPFVMAHVRTVGPKRGSGFFQQEPESEGTIPARGPDALRRAPEQPGANDVVSQEITLP